MTQTIATKTGRAAIGVLAAGALAFEQSPANEALRAGVGLDVLERTGSSLAVGGTVAIITIVIEAVSGGLVALGIHQFPAMLDRLRRVGRASSAEATNEVGSLVTDLAVALGIGSAFVVLRRAAVDREATLRSHLRVVALATLAIATVSGLIGMLAAGGINHAEKVGLETPARWIIDYGTNWRFWLVVGVVAQFGPMLWRRVRGR